MFDYYSEFYTYFQKIILDKVSIYLNSFKIVNKINIHLKPKTVYKNITFFPADSHEHHKLNEQNRGFLLYNLNPQTCIPANPVKVLST